MRGFTLLEMLVVLAILGLLMAVAMPRTGGKTSAIAAAKLLAADLARARAEAESANRDVVVVIDVQARAWSGAGRTGTLPKHLRLELTAAETERLDRDKAGIRFYAEGGASGGRVVVLGATKAVVEVDWLTGGVGVDEK
jgi:general secretion pathway protein H